MTAEFFGNGEFQSKSLRPFPEALQRKAIPNCQWSASFIAVCIALLRKNGRMTGRDLKERISIQSTAVYLHVDILDSTIQCIRYYCKLPQAVGEEPMKRSPMFCLQNKQIILFRTYLSPYFMFSYFSCPAEQLVFKLVLRCSKMLSNRRCSIMMLRPCALLTF